MKIAVSAGGKDLDSQIDPRFGRCAYFVIVETDDMSFEALDNEGITLGGGGRHSSGPACGIQGRKNCNHWELRPQCGENAFCCRS